MSTILFVGETHLTYPNHSINQTTIQTELTTVTLITFWMLTVQF